MATKTNKPTTKAKNAKVIAGIDKNLASMKAIVLGGVTYTPDELKAIYTADNAAIDATDSAHKALAQRVLDERTSRANTAKVTRALRSFLIGYYGEEAVAIIGDFGLNAPKLGATRTAASKALASAKAVATRKARGVRGSIQKLDVTGGVTGATLSETGSGAKIAPTTATGTSPAANAPAAHAAASAGPSAAPAATGGAEPAATPAPMPPAKAGPQS
jgi:hypothetical protein